MSKADGEPVELLLQLVMVDQLPLLFTGIVAGNVGFVLKMRNIRSSE